MTASDALARANTHLTTEEQALLRLLLTRELDDLAAQATEARATADELTGQSDVDSLLEREVATEAAGQADAAVQDARSALARLDDGTYGLCEVCDGPIPFARLEAIPHARRCVGCV